MKKQIVVIGGGTAGWLTALYINKQYGDTADVKLIESEEIGILGAGEGSVPLMVNFLQDLNIDVYEFLLETKATHKLGIIFENWNGDNQNYMHEFHTSYLKQNDEYAGYETQYIGYLLKNGLNPNDFGIGKSMLLNQKSPILVDGNVPSGYSFHFDANLTAKYFRKVAESRGVKRIEGKAKRFMQKDNGDVSAVILQSGMTIKSDFLFDCSGFKQMVIGKLYNTEWKTYKDKLTVNSATAFFLPQSTTELKPYTRAIAMKYGWMWQVPLQHRWGCGYIFDDKYINEEEAKQEVEEMLGHDVKIVRNFKFNCGRYEKVWINNCIAIGLSSGFNEPLEATALLVSMVQLSELDKDIIDRSSDKDIEIYNNKISSYNDDIVDFLQFHYLTTRKDTPFWTSYWESNMSESLKHVLESYKSKNVIDLVYNPNLCFNRRNFIECGRGQGVFTDEFFINQYEDFGDKELIERIHQYNSTKIKELMGKSITYKNFLTMIKIAYDRVKIN
jgi:tryptophan halogenase